jgi:hypothetical protein
MQHVEIRVEGHMDSTWEEWLDGLTLTIPIRMRLG